MRWLAALLLSSCAAATVSAPSRDHPASAEAPARKLTPRHDVLAAAGAVPIPAGTSTVAPPAAHPHHGHH